MYLLYRIYGPHTTKKFVYAAIVTALHVIRSTHFIPLGQMLKPNYQREVYQSQRQESIREKVKNETRAKG